MPRHKKIERSAKSSEGAGAGKKRLKKKRKEASGGPAKK